MGVEWVGRGRNIVVGKGIKGDHHVTDPFVSASYLPDLAAVVRKLVAGVQQPHWNHKWRA